LAQKLALGHADDLSRTGGAGESYVDRDPEDRQLGVAGKDSHLLKSRDR
jgi:hypothetical protein